MPRNYAAEYAKRKANEQIRARTERRPFSMAKARGHTSREHEALERRLRRTAKGIRVDSQGRIVRPMEQGTQIRTRGFIDQYGEENVRGGLDLRRDATRAYEKGDMKRAKEIYAQRDPDLPDWMFWYHGIFG